MCRILQTQTLLPMVCRTRWNLPKYYVTQTCCAAQISTSNFHSEMRLKVTVHQPLIILLSLWLTRAWAFLLQAGQTAAYSLDRLWLQAEATCEVQHLWLCRSQWGWAHAKREAKRHNRINSSAASYLLLWRRREPPSHHLTARGEEGISLPYAHSRARMSTWPTRLGLQPYQWQSLPLPWVWEERHSICRQMALWNILACTLVGLREAAVSIIWRGTTRSITSELGLLQSATKHLGLQSL
jgi:hypothetical protein